MLRNAINDMFEMCDEKFSLEENAIIQIFIFRLYNGMKDIFGENVFLLDL